METKQLQMKEAQIQCGKCGNRNFELRLVEVEGIKSIIAHCSCGKVVEYRGIQEAINMTPDVMSKRRAYDIVNAMGGICATEKEVKEAYKVLEGN